jgi:hypothetical protein
VKLLAALVAFVAAFTFWGHEVLSALLLAWLALAALGIFILFAGLVGHAVSIKYWSNRAIEVFNVVGDHGSNV